MSIHTLDRAGEVRVNVVCPGFVDSSWWEPAAGGADARGAGARTLEAIAAGNVHGQVPPLRENYPRLVIRKQRPFFETLPRKNKRRGEAWISRP